VDDAPPAQISGRLRQLVAAPVAAGTIAATPAM
jgi:hypothetical protein